MTRMFYVIGFACGSAAIALLVSLFFWARLVLRSARDARTMLLVQGDQLGLTYVPGEDLDEYRRKVVRERDRRAILARDNPES